MIKLKTTPIILILLCSILVNSCGGTLPKSEEYINLHPIWDQTFPEEKLNAVLSKYDIEIPFYVSKPGAVIHAVVIPINIRILSNSVTYDRVSVAANLLERDGTKYFDNTGNAAILTAIPQSIDRTTDIEASRKLAANFATAVSEITGSVSAEQVDKESYTKFYRIATANIESPTFVSWVFTPFKDESIPSGTYYLIALIEVRNHAHEFVLQVHANCTYSTPTLFGLSKEEGTCTSTPIKFILPETADIL